MESRAFSFAGVEEAVVRSFLGDPGIVFFVVCFLLGEEKINELCVSKTNFEKRM